MFITKSIRLRCIPPLINRVMSLEFNNRAFNSLPIVHDVLTNKPIRSSVTYPLFSIIRNKSKKAAAEDSDDEQDFLDDDNSLTKDSKLIKFTTTSLRTDAVLKSSLGISRKPKEAVTYTEANISVVTGSKVSVTQLLKGKIEQLFYESKIRVNGRKILKKSAPIRADYEIDVIKQVSPKNPGHLYVARVEVLNIAAKEENIQFTVRRFKNLLIDNYEKDPYKFGDTDGQHNQ